MATKLEEESAIEPSSYSMSYIPSLKKKTTQKTGGTLISFLYFYGQK